MPSKMLVAPGIAFSLKAFQRKCPACSYSFSNKKGSPIRFLVAEHRNSETHFKASLRLRMNEHFIEMGGGGRG